jgi:tRNA A37 threonylcarbamoyladenosine dehydratase
MDDRFTRTEALLGTDAIERLRSAKVAVFGLGGVGSYITEALARAGVGSLVLIDGDEVAVSNLNRQLIATTETVGMRKTDAARARIAAIAPDCAVETYDLFYLPENADTIPFDGLSCVADAVDTVSAKLEIISRARAAGIPVISCMGTGNRTVADFVISDVAKTKGCPLARVMRKELKDRGITGVDVLYSPSEPYSSSVTAEHGRHAPASICHVPAIAGMTLAGHVINQIIK